MDSLVIILGTVVGFLAGLIVLDLKQRSHAAETFKSASLDLAKLSKGIEEAHNSMATKLISLEERMSASEIRNSQQGRTSTQWASPQIPPTK